MSRLFVLVTCALSSVPIFAEDHKLRVEVDPNGVPRRNSPTSITFDVVAKGDDRVSMTLAGKDVPCQVDAVQDLLTVRWIERKLDPGEKHAYELVVSKSDAKTAKSEGAFRFVDGDGWRDLYAGKQPVYRHMTAFDADKFHDTYKVFHHVYGYHGDGFITKGDGGKYTHHRGLFIGFSKTRAGKSGYDFWHCKGVSLRHKSYVAAQEAVGPVLGRTASVTDWVDGDGKTIVRDVRTVSAWSQVEGQTLLDFHIVLEAIASDVVLDGDPQHAGFQFRAANEVAERGDTVYVRPQSAAGGKGDVWTGTTWVAGLFKIKGKPYAVMHMDSPKNPRPTVYSTRNYGRFGSFSKYNLSKGQTLALDYRVLVLDTVKHPSVTVERFEKKYRDWTVPAKVSVKK